MLQANILPAPSHSGFACQYHGTPQRRSHNSLTRRIRASNVPSYRPSHRLRPTSSAAIAVLSFHHGMSARATMLNTSACRWAVFSTRTRSCWTRWASLAIAAMRRPVSPHPREQILREQLLGLSHRCVALHGSRKSCAIRAWVVSHSSAADTQTTAFRWNGKSPSGLRPKMMTRVVVPHRIRGRLATLKLKTQTCGLPETLSHCLHLSLPQ